MTDSHPDYRQLVRDYLAALESGATGEALARFFTPDAVQEEFPNRLNPSGQVSNLSQLLERAERGRGFLASQGYTARSIIVNGSSAAVEADWVGTVALAAGPFQPGAELRARFAMFFEFEGPRIRRQRNYDCFEPW